MKKIFVVFLSLFVVLTSVLAQETVKERFSGFGTISSVTGTNPYTINIVSFTGSPRFQPNGTWLGNDVATGDVVWFDCGRYVVTTVNSAGLNSLNVTVTVPAADVTAGVSGPSTGQVCAVMRELSGYVPSFPVSGDNSGSGIPITLKSCLETHYATATAQTIAQNDKIVFTTGTTPPANTVATVQGYRLAKNNGGDGDLYEWNGSDWVLPGGGSTQNLQQVLTTGNNANDLNIINSNRVDADSVVIGGTIPQQPFHLYGTGLVSPTLSNPAYVPYSTFSLVNDGPVSMAIDRFSNNGTSTHFNLRKSRGTTLTPLSVNAGDEIANIAFWGHTGTSFTRTNLLLVSVDSISGLNMYNSLRFGAGTSSVTNTYYTKMNPFGKWVFSNNDASPIRPTETVDIDGTLRVRNSATGAATTVYGSTAVGGFKPLKLGPGVTISNDTLKVAASSGGTVNVSSRLTGNGVVALDIAQQGATTGQALAWNGTSWSPTTISGVGSGTPVEYCTDTITQASHGFSVGTPIRHNGTAWVSTIGAFGNIISATGVVVKSISSSQFVVANCGSFPTVIASGSYYQIDASPGYGVIPDTLQVPLFKVEAGQMFINPVFGITAGETLNFVDGSSVDFTKSGSNVTAELTGFNAATNGYVPSKNGTSISWIPAPTGATGSAGGDLSGTYPNPNVKKIQGDSISTTNPTSNQALVWNGSAYVPTSVDVSAADDLTGSGGSGRVAYWSSATNLTGTTSFIHDPAQGLIVGSIQINGYGTGAGWTGQGFTSVGANRTLYLKCGTNNNSSDIAGLVLDAGVLATRTASTSFEGVRMACDLQSGPGTLTSYTFFKQIPLLRHSLTTFIGNDYDPQGMSNATNHYAQLYRSGKVGFNISAPTAKVHIGAGTTTEAPFKFTRSGATLLSTPEDGALEVDATDLYHTIGSTRVKLTVKMREENFTATTSQTDFSIAYTAPAVSGTSVPVRVYRNGVRLFYVASGPTTAQFTYTGTTVTTTANTAGDIITVEYLN